MKQSGTYDCDSNSPLRVAFHRIVQKRTSTIHASDFWIHRLISRFEWLGRENPTTADTAVVGTCGCSSDGRALLDGDAAGGSTCA